jgi:hypothetical protein
VGVGALLREQLVASFRIIQRKFCSKVGIALIPT